MITDNTPWKLNAIFKQKAIDMQMSRRYFLNPRNVWLPGDDDYDDDSDYDQDDDDDEDDRRIIGRTPIFDIEISTLY